MLTVSSSYLRNDDFLGVPGLNNGESITFDSMASPKLKLLCFRFDTLRLVVSVNFSEFVDIKFQSKLLLCGVELKTRS